MFFGSTKGVTKLLARSAARSHCEASHILLIFAPFNAELNGAKLRRITDGFCPEGATGLSPRFQPWEPIPKRCALKGRQIECTSHTKAGVIVNMSQCSLLSPLQGETY